MFKRHKDRPRLDFSNETMMTEQHHKESCDVHNILKTHARTGILPHVARKAGTYFNAVGAPGYMEAQMLIADAKSTFEQVPSAIRREFDNDPAQFLAFLSDPDNRDQMAAYGFDTSHIDGQIDIEDMISFKVAEGVKKGFAEDVPPASDEDQT